MASRSLNFYIGMCNNLRRRVLEHKRGEVEGFTKRYNINRLVFYKTFRYVGNAINREKQWKGWSRAKKIALIQSENSRWQGLPEGWYTEEELQIPRCARDDKRRGVRTKAATTRPWS